MTGRPSVSFLLLSFRGFTFEIGSHEAQPALNFSTAEVGPKFLILLSPSLELELQEGNQETREGLLLCVCRLGTTSAKGEQSLRGFRASSTRKAIQHSNTHSGEGQLHTRCSSWSPGLLELRG